MIKRKITAPTVKWDLFDVPCVYEVLCLTRLAAVCFDQWVWDDGGPSESQLDNYWLGALWTRWLLSPSDPHISFHIWYDISSSRFATLRMLCNRFELLIRCPPDSNSSLLNSWPCLSLTLEDGEFAVNSALTTRYRLQSQERQCPHWAGGPKFTIKQT